MSDQVRLEFDPRVKLLLLAVVSWLVLYVTANYKLLIITVISLGVTCLSTTRIKDLLASFGPMAILITTFSLIGAFLDPRLPWVRLGPFHISTPGLAASLIVSWRVIIILWWALWFTNTTSVRSMTMALEWLLSPLSCMGMNTKEVILALVIALRFIPELLAEGQAIKEAQQLRGYRDKPEQPVAAARNLLVLIVPLLTRTWLRADDLADAIFARGYRNEQTPVRLYPLVISAWDIGAVVGITVITLWALL